MKKFYKNGLALLLVLSSVLLFTGCGNFSKADTQSAGNGQGSQDRMTQRPGFNQETVKTSLAELVKDQTITQEQADSVAEYLEKQSEERKNMSQEEREKNRQEMQKNREQNSDGNQNGSQNGGPRFNPLSELVEKGTITQEQSEKIAGVLFQKGMGRGPGQRPGNEGTN